MWPRRTSASCRPWLPGRPHACAGDVREGRAHQDGACVVAHTPNAPIALKRGSRYIINPGSVGQPRDGDPRAAYALLDTDALTWTQYRIEYPIKRTQDKMRAENFPPRLIERLEYGR